MPYSAAAASSILRHTAIRVVCVLPPCFRPLGICSDGALEYNDPESERTLLGDALEIVRHRLLRPQEAFFSGRRL